MSQGMFSERTAPSEPGTEPFALPPALSRLPGGREGAPSEFAAQNRRNQILLAAIRVFGEKGVAAATVQDLIDEASVSRATFYKYFDDKVACLSSVHEELLSWLEEEARDAAAETTDWPSAVRAVGERLVGLLLHDPHVARLCTVESMLGGPEVRARHDAALAALAAGLRNGRAERPWGEELPEALELSLLAGVLAVVGAATVVGPSTAAKLLSGDFPEIVLIPYLGAEDARRAVCDQS